MPEVGLASSRRFRHDPTGPASHVIVTVHDGEVFPLDAGPMSSKPSSWDSPGVAEQPPGPNCWSHARLPVSALALELPLPKFLTMYWSAPGSP
jgi:hypothetical protein